MLELPLVFVLILMYLVELLSSSLFKGVGFPEPQDWGNTWLFSSSEAEPKIQLCRELLESREQSPLLNKVLCQ